MTSLYCQLWKYRPGALSLPAVRELHLSALLRPPPFFLLPPLLRCLYFTFTFWPRGDHPADKQYLSAVADQAHFLEELSLYGLVQLAPFARLPELKYLHTLQLSGAELPEGAMRIISALPALTHLELPKVGWKDTLSSGFSRLEYLVLAGHAPRVIELLDSLTTTHLRSIMIHNSVLDMSPSSRTEWQQCFEKIKERFEPSLRSVSTQAVARDDGLSAAELFKPLLDLHRLEEFGLSELIALSIRDVLAMASAWPNLRRLSLEIPPIFRNPDDAQLSALHCLTFFARNCPKLTHLNMGIGDQDLPTVAQFPLLSHGLTDLRLHTPHVHDYMLLARLLDRIFPWLIDVRINEDFPDPRKAGSGGIGATFLN